MNDTETSSDPFKLGPSRRGPVRRALMGLVRPVIEKTLSFPTLNDIYRRTQEDMSDRHFSERVLDELNVHCRVDAAALARIPKEGPVVVVANHPFGGLEGIILNAVLRRARPDVKILANHVLRIIPPLRDSLLFVDPFGRSGSVGRNLGAIRASVKWVRKGGMLGVFPSGEVSHLSLQRRGVTDPMWHATAARIIQKTGAAALPVFFEGRNSHLFQLLGLLHPRLRTIMLPNELLKKRHSEIDIRIGRSVSPENIARLGSAEDLTEYLRVHTYVLRSDSKRSIANRTDDLTVSGDVIAEGASGEILSKEVAGIKHAPLMESGEYAVYCCEAGEIPHLLPEIGRLREQAFRQVGEGTGRALDLDKFDEYYHHLFVWHRGTSQLVGAYRIGITEDILSRFGTKGMYTRTLFKYKRRVLEKMGPSLELGRSFVRPEFQRSHSPLLLLWKGIGRYVARNPRNKVLFGPVSISKDYRSTSKRLLMTFLKENRMLSDLARMVKPKNKPKLGRLVDWSNEGASLAARDMKEVDDLVGAAENAVRSMPVLLKQYLKLNARMIGFNTDPEFNNSIDALMVVDLTKTSRDILTRYMGKEEAAEFLAQHGETL